MQELRLSLYGVAIIVALLTAIRLLEVKHVLASLFGALLLIMALNNSVLATMLIYKMFEGETPSWFQLAATMNTGLTAVVVISIFVMLHRGINNGDV